MKRSVPITVLLLLSIFLASFIPSADTDAAVSKDDISVISELENMEIIAGSTITYDIVIINNLPNSSDLTNQRIINLNFKTESDITVNTDDTFIILEGQSMKTVSIKFSTGKYIETGVYEMEIKLTIRNTLNEEVVNSHTYDVVVVSSILDESVFNKILGYFNNPFPAPFNTPLATSLISFVLCIILGLIGMAIISPILFHMFARDKSKEHRQMVFQGIFKLLTIAIILYAAGLSLTVYGAGADVIDAFNILSSVLYIMVGAIIAWKMYKIFVSYALKKVHSELSLEDNNENSDLEPLFFLVGKILIGAVSTAAIAAGFGLNLAAIITSAGLVSLGITYGAQNVLNQFFSGVVLLTTRPFKAKDLVTIGADTTIYKVKKVSVMNTMFENWVNSETIIQPNNVVASSKIVNLTGKSLNYKITPSMSISYGDDVDLAKNEMLKIGMDHPRIVKDGSEDMPFTRTTFKDSSIEITLYAYVDYFYDKGSIANNITETAYKRFLELGFHIPYPQMDIHMDYVEKKT